MTATMGTTARLFGGDVDLEGSGTRQLTVGRSSVRDTDAFDTQSKENA